MQTQENLKRLSQTETKEENFVKAMEERKDAMVNSLWQPISLILRQLCHVYADRNLELDYLDLYLIHWPVSGKPLPPAYPIEPGGFRAFDFKGVWAAMEECQKLGLTKAIGVSNFTRKMLEQLLSTTSIPPDVNQVAIRWAYKQGITLVVKSFNKDRMKENLDIFNWKLSPKDHEKIKGVPQGRTCTCLAYTSPFGPIRTVEELWDGEA